MHSRKLATCTASAVVTLVIGVPAAADSGTSLTLFAYREATAIYSSYPPTCERTRVEASIKVAEEWRLGEPAVRDLWPSFVLRINNDCPLGARRVQVLSTDMEELRPTSKPNLDLALRTGSMRFRGNVHVNVCNEIAGGRFTCQDAGLAPLSVDVTWTGKGQIERTESHQTSPVDADSLFLHSERTAQREADVTISGKVGEHVINVATTGTLGEGGTLDLRPQAQ